MNRALWTVALNSIMQADTSEENDLTLPRAFDDIPVPIYLRGVRGLPRRCCRCCCHTIGHLVMRTTSCSRDHADWYISSLQESGHRKQLAWKHVLQSVCRGL